MGMESRRRHVHHRQVDQPGQAEGNQHVDVREAQDLAAIARPLRLDPVLGEAGMDVDRVGHDRRPHDADRQEDRARVAQPGDGRALQHAGPVRAGQEGLDQVADRHHSDQAADDRLDGAEAAALEGQDGVGGDAGDGGADQQGKAEEEVEGDRRAEELGQVGRHRGDLADSPHGERDRSREVLPRELGQVLPGGDANLGREGLE